MEEIRRLVGRADIYLLDLLLSGHVPEDGPILDAGCGGGRNLPLLGRLGRHVYAVDQEADALARARGLIAEAPDCDRESFHFDRRPLHALGFGDERFGLVVCNAVLHFSTDEAAFEEAVREMWRVLAPGGVLFTRLASTIGIESLVVPCTERSDRWHTLPDGSDRFLVDLAFLEDWTERLGADLVGPIKTVNVQGLRCMTNWVLAKPQA